MKETLFEGWLLKLDNVEMSEQKLSFLLTNSTQRQSTTTLNITQANQNFFCKNILNQYILIVRIFEC